MNKFKSFNFQASKSISSDVMCIDEKEPEKSETVSNWVEDVCSVSCMCVCAYQAVCVKLCMCQAVCVRVSSCMHIYVKLCVCRTVCVSSCVRVKLCTYQAVSSCVRVKLCTVSSCVCQVVACQAVCVSIYVCQAV